MIVDGGNLGGIGAPCNDVETVIADVSDTFSRASIVNLYIGKFLEQLERYLETTNIQVSSIPSGFCLRKLTEPGFKDFKPFARLQVPEWLSCQVSNRSFVDEDVLACEYSSIALGVLHQGNENASGEVKCSLRYLSGNVDNTFDVNTFHNDLSSVTVGFTITLNNAVQAYRARRVVLSCSCSSVSGKSSTGELGVVKF